MLELPKVFRVKLCSSFKEIKEVYGGHYNINSGDSDFDMSYESDDMDDEEDDISFEEDDSDMDVD